MPEQEFLKIWSGKQPHYKKMNWSECYRDSHPGQNKIYGICGKSGIGLPLIVAGLDLAPIMPSAP